MGIVQLAAHEIDKFILYMRDGYAALHTLLGGTGLIRRRVSVPNLGMLLEWARLGNQKISAPSAADPW